MAKIFNFAPIQARSNLTSARKRVIARRFLQKASELLETMSEHERRIGWLLHDCAHMLESSSHETLALDPLPECEGDEITARTPQVDLGPDSRSTGRGAANLEDLRAR